MIVQICLKDAAIKHIGHNIHLFKCVKYRNWKLPHKQGITQEEQTPQFSQSLDFSVLKSVVYIGFAFPGDAPSFVHLYKSISKGVDITLLQLLVSYILVRHQHVHSLVQIKRISALMDIVCCVICRFCERGVTYGDAFTVLDQSVEVIEFAMPAMVVRLYDTVTRPLDNSVEF